MGYMCHHALIVTSWDDDLIAKTHAHALGLAEQTDGDDPLTRDWAGLITPITGSVVNGYRSFAVMPDGSKEGWGTSDHGDWLRAELIRHMETTRYDDGSGCLDWVLVQFGDDEGQTRIVNDSDAYKREDAP